jgi:hypothetical protein
MTSERVTHRVTVRRGGRILLVAYAHSSAVAGRLRGVYERCGMTVDVDPVEQPCDALTAVM